MDPTQSRYVEMIEAVFHRYKNPDGSVRTDNPEIRACFYSQIQTIVTDITYFARVNLKLAANSPQDYMDKSAKLDTMIEQYKIALNILLTDVVIDPALYTQLIEALAKDAKDQNTLPPSSSK